MKRLIGALFLATASYALSQIISSGTSETPASNDYIITFNGTNSGAPFYWPTIVGKGAKGATTKGAIVVSSSDLDTIIKTNTAAFIASNSVPIQVPDSVAVLKSNVVYAAAFAKDASVNPNAITKASALNTLAKMLSDISESP